MSRFSRFKRSAVRFLRQVFHKPKAKISRGSILLTIALCLIFFAALGLRLAPLLDSQPIVRAFDPWFQLKVSEYITENGFGAFFSWHDETTWFPFGRNMTTTTYLGVPFTTAIFHQIINGFGISVEILAVALVIPAFFGALTAIVAFFLGRELVNNTVGLLSALFLAFMPAFIQRTIAGFYDNEFIGVFAIVTTLYFFTRSIKRGSLPSAVAAGLSLAYLMGSWGAADFLTDLIAMYAFFMLVLGRYNKKLLSSYLITVALGLFIGGLVPRNGFANLTSFQLLAPIGIGVLLAGYEVWLRIGGYREATAQALTPYVRQILLGVITPIVGAATYFLYAGNADLDISTYNSNPILTIGGKFLTVINPFYRLDQRIFASVAEHLPSPWSSFYNTLLVLIFFFPLGMYFVFKRGRDEDWLIFLYGVTAVYFTGSMIRLGLVLAPGVAILSAIAVNSALSPFAKVVTQKSVFERRRFRMSSSLTSEHAIAAFAFLGLLLSVNVFLGVQYATAGIANPEFARAPVSDSSQWTDWQTSMTYIRNVLPDTAVIASWWDYGYWINGASGANTIVDNATFNSTQIALMGYALMSTSLTESLKTFKLWNTTHVLVYWGHRLPFFGGDDGKWPWMVRIAEDKFGSSVIDDATYLGDDPASDTVETEYTLDPFFESTLFKLMLFDESRTAEEANEKGSQGGIDQQDGSYLFDSRWVSHIPDSLYGAFELAFLSSAFGTVKLYEVDYTMYEQYLNKTGADWSLEKSTLADTYADGTLSGSERAFSNYDVIFGGGFEATVYTEANSTHIYYGIDMANYTLGDDAFGIQIAPTDSTSNPDIRIVNYDGNEHFDGHVDYNGDWAADSSGANATQFGTGEGVIEFIIPLDSSDHQDLQLNPGMNYQIRLMWWDNVDAGEPTFTTEWIDFWVPVDLY
jgi:dolichyl-diphosphooligosaccharide--protein glycosyltransferase